MNDETDNGSELAIALAFAVLAAIIAILFVGALGFGLAAAGG